MRIESGKEVVAFRHQCKKHKTRFCSFPTNKSNKQHKGKGPKIQKLLRRILEPHGDLSCATAVMGPPTHDGSSIESRRSLPSELF